VCGWRPTTAASEAEHDKFDADLEKAMDLAQDADLLLVHLDGNGAVGVASKEDEDPALGPHGIAYRNGAGLRLLDFMRAREMCAATSFFAAGSLKGMARRRRDKKRNKAAGGSRRTRARRWKRKQVQRERAACHVSRRAQKAAHPAEWRVLERSKRRRDARRGSVDTLAARGAGADGGDRRNRARRTPPPHGGDRCVVAHGRPRWRVLRHPRLALARPATLAVALRRAPQRRGGGVWRCEHGRRRCPRRARARGTSAMRPGRTSGQSGTTNSTTCG